jgi:hypothetical protein
MKYFESKFLQLENKFEHLRTWLNTFPLLFSHCFHCFEKLTRPKVEISDVLKAEIKKFYRKKFGFSKPSYWIQTIDDSQLEKNQVLLEHIECEPDNRLTWLDPRGSVVKGKFTLEGAIRDVAIKRLNKKVEKIKIELTNLHVIREMGGNINIVQYFGYFKSDVYILIITLNQKIKFLK